MAGFNVIEAAADVADAARALGYQRIILRGGSFGSHWAMAVMRYHRDLVAWALLSGTEGPNHTYDSPTGVLNALKRLAGAAEQSPALAPLIPDGGLIAALETVRDRLARTPVTVSVTDSATNTRHEMEFTERDVPGWANGYTSGLGSRRGAATWPADILRLYYGDFETVARLRAQSMAAPRGNPSFSTASSYTLDCASGITAARLGQLRADPAQALAGEEFSWYQEICAPWGVDAGDAFRSVLVTDIPTVIVHGTWDVNTPLENALEVAPGFRRGKLVTVVGGSHGALGEAMSSDSTFAAGIWQFLRTGDPSGLPDSVVLAPLDWVVPEDLNQLAARKTRTRR
jgi:pimeloyl-ACP methyl ester carboxylesterase